MLYDDLLIYCARKGCPELLRKSAFRKYCRRNRGAVAHVLTKEGFVIKTVIGDSVDNVICVYGVYEEPTTRVIKALAKKCDSFIDVGCNIGYYSCLFGMQHPAARLFGIDLNPEMINRTRENLKLNNLENVTLLAIGAGASKCKMTLNIPEDRHSLSSLAYVPQRSNKVNIRTLQVDIEPLGNIIAQHEISKALLKIDAEGFEYQVFSGLSEQSIQSIQFIIFELSSKNLSRAQMKVPDLFSFPWMSRFNIYRIAEQDKGLISESVHSLVSSQSSANILLAPKDTPLHELL